MNFECILKTPTSVEKWSGLIVNIINHGSHYEMRIESRSGIMVLFGKTRFGYFAYIPDWGAGCHISDYNDLFWNAEQLTNVLGPVDGTTVAFALKAIAPKLKNLSNEN